MLAPCVTKFSIDGPAKARYADVARLLGITGVQGEAAADSLYAALLELNEDLRVPSLSEFGVAEPDFTKLIPRMATEALASGSPSNNPIIPKAHEIEALYHEVFA